ncbi:hypothetical protein V1294_001578 [Bradyrhizobium sp. AZCC 1678]
MTRNGHVYEPWCSCLNPTRRRRRAVGPRLITSRKRSPWAQRHPSSQPSKNPTMDTVSIVTKASSVIPEIVATTSPLVVTCVTVDAGSRMPDSHATPTTIAAIKGAAAAWKRKTDGKVAAIARASANPLRRVPRLSAITPAKNQTRHARGIQTNNATKYMNVGGKVPTPGGFFQSEHTLLRTRALTRL